MTATFTGRNGWVAMTLQILQTFLQRGNGWSGVNSMISAHLRALTLPAPPIAAAV